MNYNRKIMRLELSAEKALNGGYYYEPHMVKQILDDNGGVVKNINPVLLRQPVSTKNADFVLSAMEQTVLDGTGKKARVPGYRVAGKTGTAEKINPETGKDKYLTDPVPEGKPLPVEPQDVEFSDVTHTCTLSVRCNTILDNIDWLDPEKVELVPEDGVIFPTTTVTFYEGESVFNVLQREMRKAGIHMEFEDTPMYNSAYIEGINNLYEFDCGELSGWMYKVNGWFPNYGCSRYQLKEGDVIEWVYTCDLGVDVGGFYSTGG